MNFTQIYEGWKNNLIPEKDLKDLIIKVSDERIEICKGCEFHSDNRVGYKSLRLDKHCTNCGCTLSAKTKCLSCDCPLSKWKAVMTRTEEDEIDEQESKI
jgi:hypothetical protein